MGELSGDGGEDEFQETLCEHGVDAAALCEQAPASFTCKVDVVALYEQASASFTCKVNTAALCEQAPVSFTCKVAVATLCVTCDRDYHSANPLAHRHERRHRCEIP
nr:CONSTANS-like protein 1 [Ipomoea batatas]